MSATINDNETADYSMAARRAANEIDEMLGKAVTANTGHQFGFFSGVSRADIARIVQTAINAEMQSISNNQQPTQQRNVMTQKQLSSYKFADKESQAAAHEAIECVKHGKRGAFLLVGPPMSGKTHFVRECLKAKFGDASCAMMPRGEDEMAKTLFALMELGYVWFDGCKPKLKSETLACFITSPTWSGRPLFKAKIETRENNCVVFVCGNEVTMTPDLERRVKVIRLAEAGGETIDGSAESPATHGSEVDEYKVREAQNLIWQNLPGHPSTFAVCLRECGGRGKGGGICLKCARADLAKLVGDDYADKYVKAVQAVRNLEGGMLNLLNGMDEGLRTPASTNTTNDL